MKPNPLMRVARKLETLARLGEADWSALLALPCTRQAVGAGYYLVNEGARVSDCFVLIEGFACRNKVTREGGRQILSFHLPGDLLDLQHLYFPVADHSVQAITRAEIGWIAIPELIDLVCARPAIAEALWKTSLIDASIFRQWILNVGRRDAKSRVAHVLCEFVTLGMARGLATPDRLYLPMTQEAIADATGLTPVHVNRMLRQLDAEGILVRYKRQVQIEDWNRLRDIAEFDPAYLHAAA